MQKKVELIRTPFMSTLWYNTKNFGIRVFRFEQFPIIAMFFDVCGGRFLQYFRYMKIFFQTEKNDKDMEYFLCFIWAPQTGKGTDGQKECFCLVNLLKFERHRDIKKHTNNKVIINFGIPKFTITSYYWKKLDYFTIKKGHYSVHKKGFLCIAVLQKNN